MFFILLLFFVVLHRGLRNRLSGPAINNSVRQRGEQREGWVKTGGLNRCACVCTCWGCDCTCVFAFTHTLCCKSLILPAPSGHISCNRPSAKARQLTIRGGGGGGGGGGKWGGLWDGGLYQRLSIIHNHKPHTLTGLRAGISVQLCVCFSALTDMNTHTKRGAQHCGTAQKNRRED